MQNEVLNKEVKTMKHNLNPNISIDKNYNFKHVNDFIMRQIIKMIHLIFIRTEL